MIVVPAFHPLDKTGIVNLLNSMWPDMDHQTDLDSLSKRDNYTDFVALNEGTVVGYSQAAMAMWRDEQDKPHYRDDLFLLTSLAVSPESRGLGIGRQLIERVVSHIQESGFQGQFATDIELTGTSVALEKSLYRGGNFHPLRFLLGHNKRAEYEDLVSHLSVSRLVGIKTLANPESLYLPEQDREIANRILGPFFNNDSFDFQDAEIDPKYSCELPITWNRIVGVDLLEQDALSKIAFYRNNSFYICGFAPSLEKGDGEKLKLKKVSAHLRRLPTRESILEPHEVNGETANMLRDYVLQQNQAYHAQRN